MLLLAISLATSGCLVPPGNVVQISPSILPEGPDPAAQPISWGINEIYTTEAWTHAGIYSAQLNIPSYWWNVLNNQSGGVHDALPNLPANYWASGEFWAPTVRYVDGRYLMLFSAQINGGKEHCIGGATSSNGQVFQAVGGLEVCDPTHPANNPGGYFDPYLFYAPNGDLWMLYSRQWAKNGAFGGSEIRAQKLRPDGLSGYPGVNYQLVSYADVASVPGVAGHTGDDAYVENPAMIHDPDGPASYDLLVSIGTWYEPNSYSTVEIPCGQPSGGCATQLGNPPQYAAAQIMAGGPFGSNPGGASLAGDGGPAGNQMVWHASAFGVRTDFAGTTSHWP